ncbi:hypothetical protein KR76_00163 [Pimelobacter simplex]|uniref:Uncharacterized protein n=1 Tax=Nocardioides simplex TaxID=2045 RepID=A0A0C5WZS9_NOCSI|nr:hypothetical protein KR76_00163 [Pimelobacter simplex]
MSGPGTGWRRRVERPWSAGDESCPITTAGPQLGPRTQEKPP